MKNLQKYFGKQKISITVHFCKTFCFLLVKFNRLWFFQNLSLIDVHQHKSKVC